jgi:hypothetical protein
LFTIRNDRARQSNDPIPVKYTPARAASGWGWKPQNTPPEQKDAMENNFNNRSHWSFNGGATYTNDSMLLLSLSLPLSLSLVVVVVVVVVNTPDPHNFDAPIRDRQLPPRVRKRMT